MIMKPTNEILNEIQQRGYITEKEINLLKNRKNNGEKFDESLFWDNQIKVTQKQTEKGLNWLTKQRNLDVMGFTERNTLENFKYFTFRGFKDISLHDEPADFKPMYKVWSENNSFQYYELNGKIYIYN